jgi:hypothetical protein
MQPKVHIIITGNNMSTGNYAEKLVEHQQNNDKKGS